MARLGRYATLPNILVTCAAHSLEIWQLDDKVAFLNATLDEEAYAHPPDGFTLQFLSPCGNYIKVCMVCIKPLALGIMNCAQSCVSLVSLSAMLIPLCTLYKRVVAPVALIYVDDCLIAANSVSQLELVLEAIFKFLEIKNMGEPADFLGISIMHLSPSVISINQADYICRLADLYGVRSMPPRSLPMDPNVQFIKDMGPAMDNPGRYRALIGALLHLAYFTGPDISFDAVVLSRYSQSPCAAQWKTAFGVFRYCLHACVVALTCGAMQTVGGIHRDMLLFYIMQQARGRPISVRQWHSP